MLIIRLRSIKFFTTTNKSTKTHLPQIQNSNRKTKKMIRPSILIFSMIILLAILLNSTFKKRVDLPMEVPNVYTLDEIEVILGQYVSEISHEAIQHHGRFTIALSGGSLPSILGKTLKKEKYLNSVDWKNWHVFFCG